MKQTEWIIEAKCPQKEGMTLQETVRTCTECPHKIWKHPVSAAGLNSAMCPVNVRSCQVLQKWSKIDPLKIRKNRIKETMGRMGEINRLTWADVNFAEKYVILYTRKKRGGHFTPRKVSMTNRLFQILSHRYNHREKKHPWVFWHRYLDPKNMEWVEGPYKDRKEIMKTLCKKAGVRYFRYHALRHFGASILDSLNINIGSIQRILGHENRTTTEIYLHSILANPLI